MDGLDRGRRGRRSFKERLGFKVICCCGSNWGLRSTNMSFRDEDEVENEIEEPEQELVRNPARVSLGMNLAAALAAERHLRGASHEPQGTPTSNAGLRSPGTPMRVSLMRLLEEGDEAAEEMEKGRSMEMGSDSMCCVCMGRKKGAAFIPCGHTFCRVCSRELWLNRGSCPLCNRPILEILDIF